MAGGECAQKSILHSAGESWAGGTKGGTDVRVLNASRLQRRGGGGVTLVSASLLIRALTDEALLANTLPLPSVHT